MTVYTQAVQAMVAAAGVIVPDAAYGDLYDRAKTTMKNFIHAEIELENKKPAGKICNGCIVKNCRSRGKAVGCTGREVDNG